MRVVLSTISEFHFYHAAQQLERLGVLARLFTGQPRWRLRGKQLPLEKVQTYPYLQTAFEALSRVGLPPHPLKTALSWACHQTMDAYVARNLPQCDIFHALSYNGLRSGVAAQARGARWVCCAVSSHQAYQNDILREEHARAGVPYREEPPQFISYAEESYERADCIEVPSSFARCSFIERGVPADKLALIPYGTRPLALTGGETPQRRPGEFRILYVGQLSVRKGLHDLLRAFRLADLPGARLQLIGATLPESAHLLRDHACPEVEVLGIKSRRELGQYYEQADVFVLASVEEGMASVIREALAHGCPVIATTNTGGRDLFTHGVEGFEVPIRAPEAIAERLTWLWEHPDERRAMGTAARSKAAETLDWATYGERLLALYQDLSRGIRTVG